MSRKKSSAAWQDISSDLTPSAMATFKPGQVLIFEDGDKRTCLKIMRLSKGKCWVKQIELHKPEDVEVVDSGSK